MTLAHVDPKSLKKNDWNVNHVSPENEAKLDASLRRLTVFKPILVRELKNGSLEIIGGAHRVESAIRIGLTAVPIWNLGKIDDKKAKEIGLVDNERYGINDALQLADVLKDLGNMEELSEFLPYSDAEMTAIFSARDIDFDDLADPEDDPAPAPAPKAPKTHTIMRFKVALGDAERIEERIQAVMKEQGFTTADELTNAGDALVWITQNQKED